MNMPVKPQNRSCGADKIAEALKTAVTYVLTVVHARHGSMRHYYNFFFFPQQNKIFKPLPPYFGARSADDFFHFVFFKLEIAGIISHRAAETHNNIIAEGFNPSVHVYPAEAQPHAFAVIKLSDYFGRIEIISVKLESIMIPGNEV